jgi:CheY-like chemotaxis protein
MIQYAIICVDDDPFITQLLNFQMGRLVNEETTIVESFTDPKKMLPTIEEMKELGYKVPFIIVDYQMPELSGGQIIRSVKEKYPEIKCLMLSGQANELVIQQLEEEEVLDGFINKPWSEEDIKEKVNPLLAGLN